MDRVELKRRVCDAIDRRAAEIIGIGDTIWSTGGESRADTTFRKIMPQTFRSQRSASDRKRFDALRVIG